MSHAATPFLAVRARRRRRRCEAASTFTASLTRARRCLGDKLGNACSKASPIRRGGSDGRVPPMADRRSFLRSFRTPGMSLTPLETPLMAGAGALGDGEAASGRRGRGGYSQEKGNFLRRNGCKGGERDEGERRR